MVTAGDPIDRLATTGTWNRGIMRIRIASIVAAVAMVAGLLGGMPSPPAAALSPNLPFSADQLPTWQTNGIVFGIAETNGYVVAGGSFTRILPGAGQSGSPIDVAGVAILDADTGTPASCQLPLTYGAGTPIAYAVEAAPDGDTVFIGGQFSGIGGVYVSRLAEIDVVSCEVTSFRPPSISSTVMSIAATDDAVFVGGRFQTVGGQQRRSFVKLTRTGALTSWVANAYGATVSAYSSTVDPDAVARGNAIALSPQGDRVVIGGDFFYVNGTPTHSFAVVDATTGNLVQSWPASTVGNTSRTKTLVSDGERFYVGNEGYGGFDGTLSYRWSDYNRVWRDSCAGATQALLVHGDVLLQAHHHHDCGGMGMFPDGRRTYLSATLAADPTQWQLGWLPELNDGVGEHLGPRALEVATGSNGQEYLWVTGEFTRVNGTNQQSLTRFGVTDTGAPPTPTVAARTVTPGAIQVNIRSVYDPDDSDITYAVYRNGSSTPIWTGVARSQHWYRPQLTFVDTDLTPGTSYSYRVRAIDAAGNQSGLSGTVSATASATASAYATVVQADEPRLYYRYDDVAGSTWVIDSSGETVNGLNGLAENGVARTAAGAIAGDPSTSATFNDAPPGGSYPQYIWNDVIAPGPSQYTIETWFRTTSTSGGALVNYGSYQGRPRSDNGDDRVSSTVDRVVYMESSTGRLRFGVRSGSSVQTIRSGASYNNGQWHHVVATQGSGGMRLYVDGVLVGQNTVTGNGTYNGTWHVGGDNLNGYPNAGSGSTQRYFDGQLDETAVYYHALSASAVSSHFAAAAPDTQAPSVPTALSASVDGSDVSLSWSAATDNIGVAGYVVYRGTTPGFTASTASSVGTVTGTSFVDEDRPEGTWYYRVAAVDGSGNTSAASSSVAAEVEAPVGEPIVQTVTASADTMVAAVNPAATYGTSTQLSSRADTAIWSFMRFDLPAAPTGYVLSSASLRLVTSNDPTAGSTNTHQVRVVDDSWSEATTTWNSRPTSTASGVIGELSGATALNTAYTVTIATPELTARSGGAVTLRLSATTGDDNVRFLSRETGNAANRPTLTLTYTPVGGPDIAAPSVPTGVSATANGNDVTVSWSPATDDVGVTGYRVYRAETADVALTSGNLVGEVGSTSFVDSDVPAGTWHYRVTARDAAGNVSGGSASASVTMTTPDTTPPSVPTGLTAAVTGTSVALTWSAAVDDGEVVGYRVYRGTASDMPASAATLLTEVDETSYTDTGRPVGTWYYRVAAVDAAGNVGAAAAAVAAVVEEPAAEPIVQTVVADADTMVAAVNPAFAYGSNTQLSARGDTAIWSFLRFQLPDAPDGYVLGEATLRVVTSNDPTAGSNDTHQVHLVDAAWSESGTTWNNRPTAVASGVIGELSGASALNTAYTVSLAVAELASREGQAASLRVSTASGSDNVRFLSRETGNANARPSLTLTWIPG